MIIQRLFLVFISFVTLSGCSSSRTVTAPKTDTSLSIDGNLNDWQTGESLIENTESISYYATYDDNFLYLFVDIKSPFTENSIQNSGFTIYLNHSKDLRKRIGVSFPTGSFNLLREDPGTYQTFLSDSDWFNNPGNQEFLKELAEDNFERIMITERADGKSNPDYGFTDRSQLEVDGFEIATNDDSRLTTIEMRIPIDGTSIFGIQKESLWLGFAIEPPNFVINDSQYDATAQNRNQGRYGNRSRYRQPSASDQRRVLSRNLGEYERWYQLDMN